MPTKARTAKIKTLDVACPRCKAAPGGACRTDDGLPTFQHLARENAAARANTKTTPATAENPHTPTWAPPPGPTVAEADAAARARRCPTCDATENEPCRTEVLRGLYHRDRYRVPARPRRAGSRAG